jgi:uncharacterized YccA/Bax inhibitor family protein
MSATDKPVDGALFCEACDLIFRIPPGVLDRAGVQASVACPTCGRAARVQRLPDGGVAIVHGDHVMIVPRPMNSNPLVAVMIYAGAVVAIALAFAAVATRVHWALCPVVFAATLAAVGIVGGIQLALLGTLNRTYVDLMQTFLKGLPYLLFRRAPDGRRVADSTTVRT